MPVKIAIAQIQLQAGQTIILDDISWSEFESILDRSAELPISALRREFRQWVQTKI